MLCELLNSSSQRTVLFPCRLKSKHPLPFCHLDEVTSVVLFSYILSLNIVTVVVDVNLPHQETLPVFSGRYSM